MQFQKPTIAPEIDNGNVLRRHAEIHACKFSHTMEFHFFSKFWWTFFLKRHHGPSLASSVI